MRERLLERGKTSGRADDNEATIVKRFHTFVDQSKPVVDRFDTQGKVHSINAMRAPDEVFLDVKTALNARLRGIAAPYPLITEQEGRFPSSDGVAPAAPAPAIEEALAELAIAEPAPVV